MSPIILASASSSRAAMLRAAAISFRVEVSPTDEEAVKAQCRADGLAARDLALALAQAKAAPVSARFPDALVLGCDQVLETDDGGMIDKARDPQDAADILRRLSAREHYLHSGCVVLEQGREVWRGLESARLQVRPLSDKFIDDYIKQEWEHVRWCVGCYRIEGPGVQLFAGVEGTQFAIQGLPLIGLLDFLRSKGVLDA